MQRDHNRQDIRGLLEWSTVSCLTVEVLDLSSTTLHKIIDKYYKSRIVLALDSAIQRHSHIE